MVDRDGETTAGGVCHVQSCQCSHDDDVIAWIIFNYTNFLSGSVTSLKKIGESNLSSFGRRVWGEILSTSSFRGVCEIPCKYTPVRAPPGEISFHRHQETKTVLSAEKVRYGVCEKSFHKHEINTAFFGTYGHTVWKRVFTDAWVFSLFREECWSPETFCPL